jgi:hypothetical protein
MPSLGFSVENKTPARRRQVSEIRDAIDKDQTDDSGFVAGMFCLGLALLALGAYHEQARALAGHVLGF